MGKKVAVRLLAVSQEDADFAQVRDTLKEMYGDAFCVDNWNRKNGTLELSDQPLEPNTVMVVHRPATMGSTMDTYFFEGLEAHFPHFWAQLKKLDPQGYVHGVVKLMVWKQHSLWWRQLSWLHEPIRFNKITIEDEHIGGNGTQVNVVMAHLHHSKVRKDLPDVMSNFKLDVQAPDKPTPFLKSFVLRMKQYFRDGRSKLEQLYRAILKIRTCWTQRLRNWCYGNEALCSKSSKHQPCVPARQGAPHQPGATPTPPPGLQVSQSRPSESQQALLR